MVVCAGAHTAIAPEVRYAQTAPLPVNPHPLTRTRTCSTSITAATIGDHFHA